MGSHLVSYFKYEPDVYYFTLYPGKNLRDGAWCNAQVRRTYPHSGVIKRIRVEKIEAKWEKARQIKRKRAYSRGSSSIGENA